MEGQTGAGREWAKTRGRRRALAWGLLAVALVAGIAMLALAVVDGMPWRAVIAVVQMVALSILVWVVVSPRTRIDQDGVAVRGEWGRTQRVSPDGLGGAVVHADRWATPEVTLELADGRRVGLLGVKTDEVGEVEAALARSLG